VLAAHAGDLNLSQRIICRFRTASGAVAAEIVARLSEELKLIGWGEPKFKMN